MEPDKQRKMLELYGEYRSGEPQGSWLHRETKRNTDNLALFEAMIRLAFPNVTLVVAGHHIMVMCEGVPAPIEIASADTLIFDHRIAQAVWGDDYINALNIFAAAPTADDRDSAVRANFNHRHGTSF
jgi:hypothetical protein